MIWGLGYVGEVARGEAGDRGLAVEGASDQGVGTLACWNDASAGPQVFVLQACLGLEGRQAVEGWPLGAHQSLGWCEATPRLLGLRPWAEQAVGLEAARASCLKQLYDNM